MYYRFIKEALTQETLAQPTKWVRIKSCAFNSYLQSLLRAGVIETKDESNSPLQARNRRLFILQGQIEGNLRMTWLLAEEVKRVYPNQNYFGMTSLEIIRLGDHLIAREREFASDMKALATKPEQEI